MRTRITPFSIFTALLISSCTSPSFLGFESQKIQTSVAIIEKSDVKPNHIFQRELLNAVTIDNAIIKNLDPSSPVIVSNYNLYPFNGQKSRIDSNWIMYASTVDENINKEFNIHIEQQLINRGFIVLENEKEYNLLDNNFDEYNSTLNFEILQFGLVYERLPNTKIIRHGICKVRYKVLNKQGHLKIIKDETTKISDTIREKDLPNASETPISIEYVNFDHNRKLSNLDKNPLGGEKIRSLYTTPEEKKPEYREVITGIRFQLPTVSKRYTLWIFDNKAVNDARFQIGTYLTIAELLKLSPAKKILSSSDYANFYSMVTTDELNEYFERTNEITIFYKSKQLCILRKNSDGTIEAI